MTIADYVILAVILLSAIIGLFRGFFREALSLASWILASYVAFMFGPALADQLTDYISTPSVRLAGAYAALFICTLIIGAVVNYFVGKLVKSSGFAGTDKVLGLVFGGARGVIIVLVFIMLASITVVGEDPWYKNSTVITYLSPWAEKMREMIPENLDEQLKAPQTLPSEALPAQENNAPQETE